MMHTLDRASVLGELVLQFGFDLPRSGYNLNDWGNSKQLIDVTQLVSHLSILFIEIHFPT